MSVSKIRRFLHRAERLLGLYEQARHGRRRHHKRRHASSIKGEVVRQVLRRIR